MTTETLNIIIPAFNEEACIEQTVRQIFAIESNLPIPLHVIVVNDYSTDRTAEIVRSMQLTFSHLTLINRRGNHGLGRCINRGIEEARDGYIAIMMADLADDPNDLAPMLLKLREEHFDLVCGSRYIHGGHANHHLRLKGNLSFILGKAIQLLTGIPTCDATNAFKMYKTSWLDKIGILYSDNYASGIEIAVRTYCQGGRVTEIPTRWQDRSFGTSHFKILKTGPEYLYWFVWAVFKSSIHRLQNFIK